MENNYFIFYESFYDQVSVLKPEDRGRFLGYIIEYGLTGKEPDLSDIELALWKGLKYALDSQKYRRVKNSENASKRWQKKGNEAVELSTELSTDFSTYDTDVCENMPIDATLCESMRLDAVALEENAKSRNEMNRNEMNRREREIEAHPVDNSEAVENSEPVENSFTLSPSVSKNYSDAVFDVFKENGLPCSNSNNLTFYQRDFYQGIGYIRQNYPGLHSDEVIQACKNYASIVTDKSCFYHTKMNFNSFVRNKQFEAFLPENFVKENWVKYSETEKKDKEMKPAVSLMDRLKRPTVCQFCGGSMTIASETPDFCSVRCAECSSWAEYDFTNKKWDWEDRYNAAVS